MNITLPSPGGDILAGLRHRAKTLARALRAHAALAPVESLDDATMRDLGIRASDLVSFRAEAQGRADLTRLRVARGFERHLVA
jgi:hypothetical protein